MKKSEFQKIQERQERRMFWRKHKEDIKDLLECFFLFVMMYFMGVVLLCM